ncbi:hypothetical protein GE061_015534 [Apolygus lucorum]|uniref:Uncharacterized protein n=1 Tax=Apolygus lucorum TaxID=248454 RepID=A0A6A4J1D4_APOLU|nr:hypothetical protein GE061_015534 [Apolygus lucorum]
MTAVEWTGTNKCKGEEEEDKESVIRDSRDNVQILPSDGHRYVCYQNNKVAGIVTVIPVKTPPNIVEVDAALILVFLGLVLLTYVARTLYFNRRLVRAVEKDF